MSARAVSGVLALVFAAVTCAGIGFTAARASAVFHELSETGRPGYLTLALDSQSALRAELEPGQSMRWLVQASLRDADAGTLAVELRADGDLVAASGMTAEVEACSGSFDLSAAPARCGGSRTTVLPATPLARVAREGALYELAELRSGEPREVLVTLGIPSTTSAAAVEGRTANVGLGVHSAGSDASVTPVPPSERPPLPVTGSDALALGLLATGLAGLGAAAALRGRARSRAVSRTPAADASLPGGPR